MVGRKDHEGDDPDAAIDVTDALKRQDQGTPRAW